MAFLFKLETSDGVPAEPPTLSMHHVGHAE
jgi:hypothetical protein